MSVNCRFALDEERYVIDAVNVANSGKVQCHEGAPEDDKYLWPAPGSEDTELGVLMEPEVGHGETEVYAGVQA